MNGLRRKIKVFAEFVGTGRSEAESSFRADQITKCLVLRVNCLQHYKHTPRFRKGEF
jgi:hypothetical protein